MESIGLINEYVCDNNHVTVTINKHDGMTAAYIKCSQCDKMALTQFYCVNQNQKPTHEWYSPSKHEIENLPENEELIDYVKNRGLLLREVTEQTLKIFDLI